MLLFHEIKKRIEVSHKIKEIKMEEKLGTKLKKRRASVFDSYINEVNEYLKLELTIKNVYRLIIKDMKKKPTYIAFYMWVKKKSIEATIKEV